MKIAFDKGVGGEFYTYRLLEKCGEKNCSKLVWSAYMVKAGVDIDRNKGLGVYPNDILYYRYSRVYKTLQVQILTMVIRKQELFCLMKRIIFNIKKTHTILVV